MKTPDLRILWCFCLLAVTAGTAAGQNFHGIAWNDGRQSYLGTITCNGPTNACNNVQCGPAVGPGPQSITLIVKYHNAQQVDIDVIVPTADPPGNYGFGCNILPGQGTITVYESPPLINSNGVVNDSTGGNSVTAGTSGYLSVYGIALTAGGKTPNPSVSVSDPGQITLTVSYASDQQVNLMFDVAPSTPNGTYSLWITTSAGTSNAGTFSVVGH